MTAYPFYSILDKYLSPEDLCTDNFNHRYRANLTRTF